ncbi:MAG: hypothetical protein KIT33_15515 [Candidatus Kapabacteria bacterium]|nr:hypothetical protein [Ignavibacteriota bacterium]MCW5886378.1 hypothetical protein [Candidatus Kapabacteria bacterium]
MTKQEFDEISWSANTEVLHNGKWYKVNSINFDFYYINVTYDNHATNTIGCESIEDVRESKKAFLAPPKVTRKYNLKLIIFSLALVLIAGIGAIDVRYTLIAAFPIALILAYIFNRINRRKEKDEGD